MLTGTPHLPPRPAGARPFPWSPDDARIAARVDEARRHADPRDEAAELDAAFARALAPQS